MSRATERERERENREAWRTGEPTPGGSQSINSLTRSPTKRDLLLLSPYARNATIYTANLEASITYAHSACLQPFCNRSPCTVSSRISSPPLRERERERRRRNRRRRSCAHTFEDDERERERESWLSARSKESGNGSSSILNSSSRFLYILENFLLLLIIYCEIYFILLIFEEIENFLLLLLLIIYL